MPILGDTKLRLLGSYLEFDELEIADRDMSDNLIVNSITTDASREWVAELNWSSQNDAGLEWIFGIFYLGTEGSTKIDAPASISVPPLPNPIEINSLQFFDRTAESVATFFRGSYHITPNLRIEAGLRYSHDWKTSHKVAPPFNLTPAIPLFLPVNDFRSGDWGRFSGEIGLNYKYDDDKLFYAKFSTGYKAGSLNNDIPVLGAEPATPDNPNCFEGICSYPDAGPEDLFAGEIGTKNDFFDRRLRVNFTAFAYYYNNLQVSQLFESGNFIENAASALNAGFELELSGRPWRELTLVGQFSYLYTEYLDFDMCTDIRSNTPANCTGNQLTRAPTFSGTFIAFYDFDLQRYGTFTPRFQVYGSDAVFFRPLNADIDKMGPYALLDFRFIWREADGRFGIEAFIMNALDQDVITTKIVGSALLGSPDFTAYDRPRTIGLRMSISL
jgi:iron complex outermembrane receptor protein